MILHVENKSAKVFSFENGKSALLCTTLSLLECREIEQGDKIKNGEPTCGQSVYLKRQV